MLSQQWNFRFTFWYLLLISILTYWGCFFFLSFWVFVSDGDDYESENFLEEVLSRSVDMGPCKLANELRWPKKFKEFELLFLYDAFLFLFMNLSESIFLNWIRIFVGTWNVAGRSPIGSLAVDLDDWLNLKDAADLYVLGYVYIDPKKQNSFFNNWALNFNWVFILLCFWRADFRRLYR